MSTCIFSTFVRVRRYSSGWKGGFKPGTYPCIRPCCCLIHNSLINSFLQKVNLREAKEINKESKILPIWNRRLCIFTVILQILHSTSNNWSCPGHSPNKFISAKTKVLVANMVQSCNRSQDIFIE